MKQCTNIQAQSYFDIANQLTDATDWDNAIIHFCRAIELEPDWAEAYNNLGLVFKNIEQLDKAEAFLRKAIEKDPDCINAYYNLGFVYKKSGYLTDAEYCFRRVIELEPDNPNNYNNLGVILARLFRLDEAEQCYHRAIELKPDYSVAYYNLGSVYKLTDRFAQTEVCLRRACEISPENYNIDLGLAFFYLSIEQFEKGWKKYDEALLKSPEEYGTPQIQPWHGEDLTGKKILLYYGKGLGDTLQFVRYTQKVANLAAQTALLVQKPLQQLLAANYSPLTVYAEGDIFPSDFDFACSLQNLPIVFNTIEQTIPSFSSYLQALPQDIEDWSHRLRSIDGGKRYRVGVVWAGNIKNPMDRFRSIPFAQFNQLFTIKEVSWISLQVGSRAGDREHMIGELLDVSPHLIDFCQTAGVIENLDLVITMDTSVAHLAGAMGKKTWILLDSNCDWRWHIKRTDSSWYPSVQLFRQQKIGDWPELLARVATALRKEIVL